MGSTAHQLKQPGRRDQLPAPHHQLLRHKPCARSRCVVSPISRAFSRVFLAFPLADSPAWSCDRLVSADTWCIEKPSSPPRQVNLMTALLSPVLRLSSTTLRCA